MSEEAPAAPAPEAAPAEPSTPATPAPEAAPAPAAEQPAQPAATAPTTEATPNKSYFNDEQLAEMQKFIENNGGYDTAWKKMKASISSPQKAPEAPSQPQVAQTPDQQPEAPQNAPQGQIAGTISMEEMAAMQYFNNLANDPKYAGIADEIKSGEVLKGLKDFNINPLEGGRINDANVRKYLDLYAATKPPKPTTSEPMSNPGLTDNTADIQKVTTREEADRIQLEDIRRRSAGQPAHPLAEEAKQFIKDYYSPKKK